MEIEIISEEFKPEENSFTGGEYALCKVQVYIDNNLPFVYQQERVIHAVIENYCRCWPHDQVQELTEFIMDGLIQLNTEANEGNQPA